MKTLPKPSALRWLGLGSAVALAACASAGTDASNAEKRVEIGATNGQYETGVHFHTNGARLGGEYTTPNERGAVRRERGFGLFSNRNRGGKYESHMCGFGRFEIATSFVRTQEVVTEEGIETRPTECILKNPNVVAQWQRYVAALNGALRATAKAYFGGTIPAEFRAGVTAKSTAIKASGQSGCFYRHDVTKPRQDDNGFHISNDGWDCAAIMTVDFGFGEYRTSQQGVANGTTYYNGTFDDVLPTLVGRDAVIRYDQLDPSWVQNRKDRFLPTDFPFSDLRQFVPNSVISRQLDESFHNLRVEENEDVCGRAGDPTGQTGRYVIIPTFIPVLDGVDWTETAPTGVDPRQTFGVGPSRGGNGPAKACNSAIGA